MSLKRNSTTAKVGIDLFSIQVKWALWFIGIVFVVYLVLPIFITNVEEFKMHFLTFSFQPAKIFMLIIGILSCFSFLGYFVGNGITRKDYFLGSAAAAFGVAFVIMLLANVLQGLLQFVGMFTPYLPSTNHGDSWNMGSVWIVPFVAYTMTIVVYYLAGWLISIGFYRYGGIGGTLCIIGAIIYVGVTDLGSNGDRSLTLFGFIKIPYPDLGLPLAMVVTAVLIVVGLWLLRQLTKRVPIKLD
ncbi:hypothetical protein [Alkalihalobacterium sp. APHAB7]|uniref:hypothetical protein n=1 Tax=Alkalihalobacterium sp. APHAB7 TaxID=3402081 RepID=UPI003AAE3A9A